MFFKKTFKKEEEEIEPVIRLESTYNDDEDGSSDRQLMQVN